MKLPLLSVALASALLLPHAHAEEETSPHIILLPDNLQWKKAPEAFPPGAMLAPLTGDNTAVGPYTIRLKFPKGYKLPPHTQFQAAHLTIISGQLFVGVGKNFDTSKGEVLSPGSFVLIPRKFPHFLEAREEVVVQLHGTAPLTLTYLNKSDDPRKK